MCIYESTYKYFSGFTCENSFQCILLVEQCKNIFTETGDEEGKGGRREGWEKENAVDSSYLTVI